MEDTATNKYYTPEIEEFHVGFEFERLITGMREHWNKVTMSVNFLSLEDIDDEIELKEIRVKHLDREDIEECGWEFDTKVEGRHQPYVYSKNNFWMRFYELEFWKFNVSILDLQFTIKNKSELIKLMSQLNIKQ
jgi:hypothetical protein